MQRLNAKFVSNDNLWFLGSKTSKSLYNNRSVFKRIPEKAKRIFKAFTRERNQNIRKKNQKVPAHKSPGA